MATKNLLESYKKRLSLAESLYSKSHNGESMDNTRRLATAKCLDNINRFMNESFTTAQATQRADMGTWKRFCLNLTNIAVPNLIAPDLVLVYPMSSMAGYFAYLSYQFGSDKGAIKAGDVYSDAFHLGDVDPNYTAEKVVETFKIATAGNTADIKVAWSPIFYDGEVDYDYITAGKDVRTGKLNPVVVSVNGVAVDTGAYTVTVTGDANDTLHIVKGTGAAFQQNDEVKVKYCYDNTIIPQNNLPTLRAEMKSIPLLAKARRIVVHYSQMAQFQSKTDYGFDLGEQISKQAVGEVMYEIDSEVINLLMETAAEDANLVWSKTLPVGVSKQEHYEGFAEILEIAKANIYNKTRRFAPNYMLIAADVLPVISFIKGFQAAPTTNINGAYLCGTLNGLRVYVSPIIKSGEFAIGVNGNDGYSSVAVYAPYMPVVPTALLQTPDGATSQGFSTLYDLKVLNKDLIVRGRVTA